MSDGNLGRLASSLDSAEKAKQTSLDYLNNWKDASGRVTELEAERETLQARVKELEEARKEAYDNEMRER